MELIGYIGSILLAFCAIPQAVSSYKNKSSEGITWGLLLMWLAGEILTLIYVIPKMDWPLLFNYTTNIILISIIVYYKIKPGDKNGC